MSAAAPAASPPAPFAPRLRGPGIDPPAGAAEPAFVDLPEHAAARAAVRSLARRPPGEPGPAVFLWGPAGCGKTLLVREFLRLDAASRGKPEPDSLVHLTAAGLAATLDEALAGGFAGPLRESLLTAETLIVEDLAALRARPKTQDLLLAAADAALAAGGRVLWTANAPPGDLPAVSRRLVDRLRGGVSAAVPTPGAESRAALLTAFAAGRSARLAPEVAATLAAGLPVSVRELIAAADRMAALARAAGAAGWTPALAAALLEGREADAAASRPTLAEVSRAVAKRFGLTVSQVRTAGRAAAVVPARQCGMALARELTGETLRAVAEHFGRSDHGTVLHAVRQFDRRLAADPAFRADAEAVRRALTRRSAAAPNSPPLRPGGRAGPAAGGRSG